jgi:hypothetical protein
MAILHNKSDEEMEKDGIEDMRRIGTLTTYWAGETIVKILKKLGEETNMREKMNPAQVLPNSIKIKGVTT